MPAMIQELVAANDGAMTAIIWELIERNTDESYRGGWGLPPWLAALRSNSSTTLERTTPQLDGGGDVKRQIITPKSCAEAGVGKKGSPQASGSAGRYPHTCHQATGMIGGKTRPRLLHVRYRRIPMYGSISTGTLPNHQRDPMEGDCLTKHSASWACKGGGASNPSGLGQTGG